MQDIHALVGKIENLEEVSNEVITELLAIPEIAEFIAQNILSNEQVIENANTFFEYRKALANPKENEQIEGYLFINGYNKVEFAYRYTENSQKILQLKEYIECLYMDEQLLLADISDFKAQVDSSAVLHALQLVTNLRNQQLPQKGLFIAGENGVGKTHMLSALAKEFSKQKQKVALVFVPELIRDLKQNPFEADKFVRKLQAVPVLMLDDIGAEMQTSFSRDEILLPILNSRMNSKKLTFFSSNFSLIDLQHHFTKTQYGENEPVKAKRMLERISALSDYVGLIGKNYRRE